MKKFLFLFAVTLVLTGCSATIPPVAEVEASPQISEEHAFVTLNTPRPGDVISPPIQIAGQAPQNWFFEGQLFAKIETDNGTVIGQGPLKTEGDWTTEKVLNFRGELKFSVPTGVQTGKLVIENDNPSGLPENQKRYEIQVRFQ